MKLVMVSAEPLAPAELRDARAGVAAVLAKPLKVSRLLDTIAEVIARQPRASRPTPSPDSTIEHGIALTHPLRVLVAEDNGVNQKVIAAMLTRMGYRADLVADGAEAVEATRRQPYDVVLMDVHMPVMDEMQATRAIRERGDGPWIVALTANATEDDRTACLDAGMNDYLSKPVSAKKLAAALRGAPRQRG